MPVKSVFKGILSCPVRAIPKGPNEKKIFKIATGFLIQNWIILVPMPVNADCKKYISDFINSFEDLCKNVYIRSAYKSGVSGITTHSGLLNQVSEEGNYWNVIQSAAKKDIVFHSCSCLSDVLMDYTINHIIYLIFGERKDPTTWDDEVKTFVSGN